MGFQKGTSGDDWLWGSPYADTILGLYGHDKIKGNGGDDSIFGDAGNDWLDGGEGSDLLNGGAGADELLGGSGFDYASYTGSVGVAVSLAGNVGYYGDAQGDTFSSIEGIWGSWYSDILIGDDNDNALVGHGGDDILWGVGGHDTINGGDGHDWLYGGMSSDRLTGGSGADTFWWSDPAECSGAPGKMDAIIDFNRAEGDLIQLANIDADTVFAGDQAFTFIGTAAFSGIGQVRYYHDNGNTFIEMQTSIPYESDPEGVFALVGIHTPDASWFVL
jgi:serralysin